MDLDYPEQCLLCLEDIVPDVNKGRAGGYEVFEVKLDNFEQLCEFLKVEFPLSCTKFKRVLAEKDRNCCELLLCSKCLEILKDISGMYAELRRIEKRIDFAIRAVQEVIKQSEEDDKEERKEEGKEATTGTTPSKEDPQEDKEGTNGEDPGESDPPAEEMKVGGKRKKLELCGGVAASSIVADYMEFVKTFRSLVKEVVTKVPEPGVLSAEADALAKIYQKLDDESGEVDIKPDIRFRPPSPANSDVVIIEPESSAEEESPSPPETESSLVSSNPPPPERIDNPPRDIPLQCVKTEKKSPPYINDSITIFEVVKTERAKQPPPNRPLVSNGRGGGGSAKRKIPPANGDSRVAVVEKPDTRSSRAFSLTTTAALPPLKPVSIPKRPSTSTKIVSPPPPSPPYNNNNNKRTCFTCRFCLKIFNSAVAYYVHRKESHPVESEALYIPSVKQTGNPPGVSSLPVLFRVCPICREHKNPKGSSFLLFIEHMLSHELLNDPTDPFSSVPGEVTLPRPEDQIFACDQCDQRFILEMNLDLHKICFHESTLLQLKCDECGDTSNKTWEDLVSHLVQDHGSHAIHSCKSCPMACTTADSLLEHMQIHALSKQLLCSECPYIAPSLKEIYQHFHECHPNLITPRKCDTCRQIFLMPATYRKHMATVHSETSQQPAPSPRVNLPASTTITPVSASSAVVTPPKTPPQPQAFYNVQCPHCLDVKLFKNQLTLDNHIRIHHDTTVSKHECHSCDKSFVHRSTLRYHIQQVHLGIRYACPHAGCDKSFTARSLLKGHLKLHTGYGPPIISCSDCSKTFSSLTALKTHQVTQHSPTIPVSCDICGRTFLNVYSLRGHKSEVHNFKPYSCPRCPQKFSRLKQFNYHLSTHGIFPRQPEPSMEVDDDDGGDVTPLSMVEVEEELLDV